MHIVPVEHKNWSYSKGIFVIRKDQYFAGRNNTKWQPLIGISQYSLIKTMQNLSNSSQYMRLIISSKILSLLCSLHENIIEVISQILPQLYSRTFTRILSQLEEHIWWFFFYNLDHYNYDLTITLVKLKHLCMDPVCDKY